MISSSHITRSNALRCQRRDCQGLGPGLKVEALEPRRYSTAAPIVPPLTAAFSAALPPTAVVAGQKAGLSEKLVLDNSGGAVVRGKFAVNYYLSATVAVDAGATQLPGTQQVLLNLPASKDATIRCRISSFPSGVSPGDYYLVAEISSPGEAAATAVTTNELVVQSPQIKLSGNLLRATEVVNVGEPLVVTLSVTNSGNIAAVGKLPVELGLNLFGGNSPFADDIIIVDHEIRLQPGKSTTFSFAAGPSLLSGNPAGSYYPVVRLDPGNTFKNVVIPDVEIQNVGVATTFNYPLMV